MNDHNKLDRDNKKNEAPAWFPVVITSLVIFCILIVLLISLNIASLSDDHFPVDNKKPADMETMIQYANDNGYSEVILEDAQPPGFRVDANSSFHYPTEEVRIGRFPVVMDVDVNLFESVDMLSLGFAEESCEIRDVSGEEVEVCGYDKTEADPVIIKLDRNGEVESIDGNGEMESTSPSDDPVTSKQGSAALSDRE